MVVLPDQVIRRYSKSGHPRAVYTQENPRLTAQLVRSVERGFSVVYTEQPRHSWLTVIGILGPQGVAGQQEPSQTLREN